MNANSSQRGLRTLISIALALVPLFGAAALAGVTLFAGPAEALVREAADTRAATSLTLTATPAVVVYGGSAVVSGDFRPAAAIVAGATLVISSSTDGLNWADVAGAITDVEGHFSLQVTPVAAYGRTVFRVTYAGSDTLQPAAAQVDV